MGEFARWLEQWWEETDRLAEARKDSPGALVRLLSLYEELDRARRIEADRVLGDWLGSDNEKRRFDALAAIDHYAIASAVPQMMMLAEVLERREGPGAAYELAKVRRILAKLTGPLP